MAFRNAAFMNHVYSSPHIQKHESHAVARRPRNAVTIKLYDECSVYKVVNFNISRKHKSNFMLEINGNLDPILLLSGTMQAFC